MLNAEHEQCVTKEDMTEQEWEEFEIKLQRICLRAMYLFRRKQNKFHRSKIIRVCKKRELRK